MQLERVVELAPAALGEAAAALGRAFHDDPLQRYLFPDEDERVRLSPLHFTPVLRYGIRFGRVYTTPGVAQGAAVWLPPGATDVTEARAAEAGLDRLGDLIGPAPVERFLQVMSALEPHHAADAPGDHWYVMVVGVAPGAQGRGWGRALLQPVIDEAEAQGHSCYLETAQPQNVPFYERLGFRVIRDFVHDGSGLRLWTFRRDPARAGR